MSCHSHKNAWSGAAPCPRPNHMAAGGSAFVHHPQIETCCLPAGPASPLGQEQPKLRTGPRLGLGLGSVGRARVRTRMPGSGVNSGLDRAKASRSVEAAIEANTGRGVADRMSGTGAQGAQLQGAHGAHGAEARETHVIMRCSGVDWGIVDAAKGRHRLTVPGVLGSSTHWSPGPNPRRSTVTILLCTPSPHRGRHQHSEGRIPAQPAGEPGVGSEGGPELGSGLG